MSTSKFDVVCKWSPHDGNCGKRERRRSTGRRLRNATCALTLLGAVVFLVLAGLNVVALTVLVAALLSVGMPVASAGESLVEVLIGVGEAVVDGLAAVVAAIATAITGIFA